MHFSKLLLFARLCFTLAASRPFPDLDDLIPTKYTNAEGKGYVLWAHKGLEQQPPVLEKRQSSPGNYTFTEGNQDYCGYSTFTKSTEGAATYPEGCQVIREFYSSNPGFYVLDQAWLSPDRYKTVFMVSDDTGAKCAFGLHSYWSVIYIGNVDIVDIISEALEKFTDIYDGEERVGGYGSADCFAEGSRHGEEALNWWIYGDVDLE